MAGIKDLPGWGQVVVGVITLLVTALLAYASLASDLRVEATERKNADDVFKRDIGDIKQMLKEEMDRHHPRHP